MNNLKNYYLNYQASSNNCNNPSSVWGSQKPLVQTCLPEYIQMKGEPCNNIWNNNTKRKNIVSSTSINNIYQLYR